MKRDYIKIWNEIKVGDFLEKWNETKKGEGRGCKVLAKSDDYLLYSYCEGCTKDWEQPCGNYSREEFIAELRLDDSGVENKSRANINIIKGEQNNKMKITNLVKKILDEDTRKLVKAGFINGELAMTDEGVSELLGIIFLEKKSELVKIAEERMDENNK